MKLTSSAFQEGASIPRKYTCQGEGINPPLHISEVPAQAKTLVLIMDDPDVPASVRKDQVFDHWVVFNISPTTREIQENTSHFATFGANTKGESAYYGPCPPDREHRYFFKLYALDTTLSLAPGSTKKQVEQAMHGHIIAQTQLMGRYVKT
jgi:Raf kinase inhibitor-like YbhB/YbcL family protein